MIPPIKPRAILRDKVKNESNSAAEFDTPNLVKKKTKAPSLTPSPLIDRGTIIMIHIIGNTMKK